MKNKFKFLYIVFFCFSFSVSAGENTKQLFWSEFRAAFLKHDFEALKDMTRFPLEVYGSLDDDPKFESIKMQFSKCVALISKSDPGIDASIKNHMDYFKKNPDLTKIFSDGKPISKEGPNEGFRVGDLLFSSAPFKLIRIYLDTTEKNVRKNCEQ